MNMAIETLDEKLALFRTQNNIGMSSTDKKACWIIRDAQLKPMNQSMLRWNV